MKTPQHRRRLRLAAGAALALSTAGLVMLPAGSAMADNAGDQAFSGSVRNYSVYVGAEILNVINARANIGEAVAVADSTGLNKPGYAGTGTGDLAVPGTIAADPTSRSYARTAVLGVGFTGLNVQPLKAESRSTSLVDGQLEKIQTPLASINLGPLGQASGLTGTADSNWNSSVLSNGGRLAYADSNFLTIGLITGFGLPIPGSIFPVASAEAGQNTSEVKLVRDATACPTGLAVKSTASWDFADVHLFGSFMDVSWGGNDGTHGPPTITATANGRVGGAVVAVPRLGDMTINAGPFSVSLLPGAAIELDKIFADGGPLGSILGRFIAGEIAYGGVTDVQQSQDGTHAHGALNGLEANLSLLPVPIVAPNGLGSAEVGIMRGEVDAVAPRGGLNCSPNSGGVTGANTSGATAGATVTGATVTGTPVTGVTTTGADVTGTPITGLTATGTPVTGVTTTGIDVTGTPITGVTTTGASTTGASATGVDVTGNTVLGTTATGTPVTGVTTTGTPVTGLTATGTPVTGVTTTGADVTGTPVTGLTATGTPVTGVTATGVDVTGASATGASATGTPVTGSVTGSVTGGTIIGTTGVAVTGATATGASTSGSVTGGTIVGTTGVAVTGATATGASATGVDVTGTTAIGTTGVAVTGTTGTTATGVVSPPGVTGTTVTGATATGATASGVVSPPGATATGASTTGAGTSVSPPSGLPNTGGVPVQLLALALGLLLVGGRLMGAARYWQKSAR